MKHTFFEIRNFKGVSQAKINLADSPVSRVFTLIGLNESGKTTLLEAINSLGYKQENLDLLNPSGNFSGDLYDLIPISQRSNFNGKITIKAGYLLNENDEENIISTDSLWLITPISQRIFSLS